MQERMKRGKLVRGGDEEGLSSGRRVQGVREGDREGKNREGEREE